ncbi:MAG: hypothetical protein IKW28_01675, partial [Lachnospiraceae bacterium]|nr:hypothetical protein [Lachnospiraceae bacterium]
MKGLKIKVLEATEIKTKTGIIEIVACILFMSGCIKIIFSGFPSVEISWWLYAGASIPVICFLFSLFCRREKTGIFLIGGGITAGIFLVGKSVCSSGIAVLVNDFLEYLTGRTGVIYLELSEKDRGGEYLIAAIV